MSATEPALQPIGPWLAAGAQHARAIGLRDLAEMLAGTARALEGDGEQEWQQPTPRAAQTLCDLLRGAMLVAGEMKLEGRSAEALRDMSFCIGSAVGIARRIVAEQPDPQPRPELDG